MKKALSLTMAAAMSVSAGIVAYADTNDSANTVVRSKLAAVKNRVDIPEEFSEFTYSVNTRASADIYSFNWETKNNSDSRGSISCSMCGSVITSYTLYRSDYKRWSDSAKMAQMTESELHAAAVKAVKRLNPTVADSISVDESVKMSVNSSTASFSLTRTSSNIPVANDTGTITLDKNTGELISFNISWHPNAAFAEAGKAIPEDKAWDNYEKMIAIKPQYEVFYNSESKSWESRLVYVQTDYGDINAFTGNKSNFQEDAFYSDEKNESISMDSAEESPAAGAENGVSFTEEELKELNVELPYGTEKAVVDLIKSNKYLTWSDGMTMERSYLTKGKHYANTDRYMFTASFTNEVKEDYWADEPMPLTGYEESYAVPSATSVSSASSERTYEYMRITVDAQTGEVLNYSYYDTNSEAADSYDMSKADALAKDIAKNLAPSHIDEYSDYTSNLSSYSYDGITHYSGSEHSFGREVNGIAVSGNSINLSFDPNMKLTDYSISYSDVKFTNPKNMLTAEQAFEKFKADNELTLCYKARLGEKTTATVLVYSAESSVYCDAFTGKPVYDWWYGSNNAENDLSGIKDKKLLKMTEALDDNGIIVSAEKFGEGDSVKLEDFARFMDLIYRNGTPISESSITLPSGIKIEEDEDYAGKTVTRGDAMVLYASAVCGNKAAELKGIYRSPFTDVKDSDKYVGYYAIAYALGATGEKTLNPSAAYTYADFIKLVYNSMK